MDDDKLGSIMRTLAKRISNHSTRKSVVAKSKKAGQPRHKIIQNTGHANECSFEDYDEVDEDERRNLSHIIIGYSKTSTTTRSSETPPSLSSLSVSCFREVYRRYRQQLPSHKQVFHHPLIKRPLVHLRCQFHVQLATQQLNTSTTALYISKTTLGRNQQTKPALHEY